MSKITEDEVKAWCVGTYSDHTVSRLTDILNKDYPLEEAREDILSFRGNDNE